MSDDPTENRTFEKYVSNWPAFHAKRPPRWWGYKGDAYYARSDAELKRQSEDAHAKIDHAFWVQQRTEKGLGLVRIKLRAGQALYPYLTKWEMLHSTLFPAFFRSVEPVVDENCTLVAHIGWFRASQILIPKGLSVMQLEGLLTMGVPAFANEYNPMPAHYNTAYTGAPESKYRVLTDPEGQVLGVTEYDPGSGAESTTPPWEYVMMGKALITLLKTGTRVAVKALVRNATKQSVATGPTVRAAEKALREAEKEAVKDAGKSAARSEATAAATKIAKQARKVTRSDMLAWEKEGGHTLQHHNPTLTKQNLRARVTGKEELSAPQLKKGGIKEADLRVWRGKTVPAASAWESEEVMHKTISDVINKNLDDIRRVTKNGGKVAIEGQKVAYNTGSGWIASKNGPFFAHLNGVSIYIEPTTLNAEGWFVRTAFPDICPLPFATY